MNLYDLTLEAEQQLATYRSPDVDEWRKQIDLVLDAAGEGCLGHDHIDNLTVGDEYLHIRTSYTVRCCECNNDYSLPIFILKAENPVQAATIFSLNSEISRVESQLRVHEAGVRSNTERLAQLKTQLEQCKLAPISESAESMDTLGL